MAKITQGILGGFSGKVGTVVGGSWKGIDYMRIHKKPSNPNTEKQVNQRTKFTTALSLLQPITPFLRVGYKLFTAKQTAFNAAMSQVLNNAIVGDAPNVDIDYSKVQVSSGTLTPAVGGVATYANEELTITWSNNAGSGSAKDTDKALVVIYNSVKGEAIFDTAGAARSEATQAFSLPVEWVGDSVQVYLGFITEDGKDVANSIFVGAVMIPANITL